MEQNIKLNLLKSIGKVYDQAKGCKLEESSLEKSEFFKVLYPNIVNI